MEYGISTAGSFSQDSSQRSVPEVLFQPSELGILERYSIIKEIYKVQLSPTIVSLAAHNDTKQAVIKKSIRKDMLIGQTQHDYARQECIIQAQLKHENVVELYDYTENEKEFVLLMEYCNDAGYFEDKIENRLTPIKNQEKLQQYGFDILTGLSYVHSQGIIHSDLKLQNALLQRPSEDDSQAGELPVVKICDFGLSHLVSETNGKAHMSYRCGTNGYIAPEIKPKDTLIGPEIDMWAFGVMLYEMCTAYKPTNLSNYRYGSGPIPFRDRDWKKHSKHVQDLILQCLQVDPSKRILPEDALQHPWFEQTF
ncbi:hypothetical protein FGO68_gene10557 [Halteria grandinella]|uniref:Protein kinase domain-containing protein n=1 Tax=Halteria grandinella TaxID=5974 RepID=A0A8J8NWQ7_HALGN|nr:hypothetical protein FGO68_gene10557 [Halteria grandinella]